jgi:signal peptidase I
LTDGSPPPGEPAAEERERAGSRRRPGRLVLEVVVLLAVAVTFAVVLRAFFGQAFSIPSVSMTPQLEVGDRVVVSKLSYRLHEPRRGDVVVFDCPPRALCPPPADDPGAPGRAARAVLEAVGVRQPTTAEFIKRVVALPGEQVEGREGVVLVDGLRLVEPYLPDGTVTSSFGPAVVPEGTVWVMGDNRQASADSRSFGPVAVDTVVGRALWRVWPPDRLAFL